MLLLSRVARHVGCTHGCGDGVRGSLGDQLRAQIFHCLSRLQKCHAEYFNQLLDILVNDLQLAELMDFLHAILGFCVDPTSAVTVTSPQERGRLREEKVVSNNLKLALNHIKCNS